MQSDSPDAPPSTRLRKYGFTLVGWSALLFASLLWNLFQDGSDMMYAATIVARANVAKDVSFRKWVDLQGGVYIPPSERTPPNPYLTLPERDVVTTTGVALTLMNPAYVMRDMQGNMGEAGGQSRITSLKPLNPYNAPDEWEARALTEFEKDRKESSEVQEIAGRLYLRLMQPLVVEKGCLKCHAQQGYRLGDIRGGVGTAVLLDPYLERQRDRGVLLLGSHGAIWLIGLLGFRLYYKRERQLVSERDRADAVLRDSESRYRRLFESNPHPMWVFDEQTLQFLAVNEEAVLRYGWTREEFLSMTVAEIRPQEDTSRLRDHMAQINSAGGRDSSIWRHRRKDGALFDVEITSHRIVFEGRPARFVMAQDITERRRTETQLRLAANVFDHALEGITITDGEGRILAVNKRFTEITGYRPEQVIGQNPRLLKSGRQSDDFYGRMWRSLQSEGRWAGELFNRRSDGSIYPEQLSIGAVRDASGTTTNYVAVFADLTQRAASEAAVRENQQKYRGIFMGAPEGVWLTGPDRRTVEVNPRLCAMLGYSPEEMNGRLPAEFSDDRNNDWLRAHWPLIRNQPERSYEIALRHKDGHNVPVNISAASLRNDDGSMRGSLAFVTDLTERKRVEQALRSSEHRYRSMFAGAPEGVWLVGPDQRTLEVNQRVCEMLGYAPEEMLGRSPLDFTDDPNRSIIEQARQVVPAPPARSYEVALRHKDGHNVAVHLNAANLYGDDGASIGVLTFVTDLTARKRIEADLRRLNEELEQRVEQRTHALQVANRELESFSYSVSHDLRAPLRAISGFSRLIESDHAGQMDEHGKMLLQRVGAAAERMGQLIEDLLKLSRISRQEMQTGPVDLSALARSVAEELQAGEPERRTRIQWEIAPGVQVVGDAGLLRVALQNLLGNAWKYSSKRDAARIEFGSAEKDGRPVYFVRDTGAGFDMAYANKLFGAFQRLHAADDFPGTGIGLATVARIIHRHGGEVWAEGKVNEGASFYFSLG